MISVLHFSLEFIFGLEWDTFYYWHRRALEIKHGTIIPEKEDGSKAGRIDKDSFEARKKRLEERLEKFRQSKEGVISG